MKKSISYFSMFLLSGLTLIGCKKTDDEKTLNYKFSVVSKVSNIGSTNTNPAVSGANTLTWEYGYLNLTEFKFEAQKNDEQIKFSYKANQPTKVDFFIPEQIIGGVSIPAGIYKKVEVKVEIKQVPPTAAIFLKGTFTTNGGAKVPVELSLTENNDEMEFGIKAKDLEVGTKNTYTGVIKLHLDVLMQGITSAELDKATRTPNNVIVINKESNVKIYEKIKNNIGNLTEVEF
ncbi:MAG TPA: hypothetical protein VEV16_03145 [Daejeonella sp.]|nr:hypothetical protein [Daejeonella sp.]